MEARQVYLDHNATTPLHPEVRRVMLEAMDCFGNPSSMHGVGRMSRQMVEDAREKVASFLGAQPDEVVFVGSGSEANNTVLSILGCPSRHCSCEHQGGRSIVTTAIEHPCVLETARCLSDRGNEVSFARVDRLGRVDWAHFESLITPHTGVASVMMANNELGTIQDIRRAADIAHRHGTLFHSDAVQAAGKIPVNVKDLDVDFLTLSGHKIYGPKGIGAVYIRRGVPFCPLIRGGHQEKGRRAGTENTIGIIALGKAVEMRAQEMEEEGQRLAVLKAALRQGIADRIPDVYFNGDPDNSLHSTLNVSFEGAEGESILLYLDLEGIAVSTGSACASGSLEPSHVLMATGMPIEHAHASVRMSMGRGTTMDEIDYVLEKLPQVIGRIRDMSTAYVRKEA